MGQNQDIKGHWAEKSVKKWQEAGVIKGYSDGTYKPDSGITRAEFVALVNSVFGFAKNADIKSPDLKAVEWYYEGFAKAKAAGYVSGYSDGTFRPNSRITRQEAAVIIGRILKVKPATFSNASGNFSDSASFSLWGKGYIGAVAANSYMGGYPDRTFRPDKPVTRGEVAVILDRVAGIVFHTPGIYGAPPENRIVAGNITVTKSGITLRNMVIQGNLYLTEGIGDGHVTLENIKVTGTTIVSGGGANSIIVVNSSLGPVVVNVPDGSRVRIVASGTTEVEKVEVLTEAKLEESGLTGQGFTEVTVSIPAGASIALAGLFGNVLLETPGIRADVSSGSIAELVVGREALNAVVSLASGVTVTTATLNTGTSITGSGQIGTANINAEGVRLEPLPGKTNVAKDITVVVGGLNVTGAVSGTTSGFSSPGTSSSSGGSGGGGNTDTAPPLFSESYPRAANVQALQCVLLVRANENGKVYYSAVPAGSVGLTAAEVKNGTAGGGVAAIVYGQVTVSADTEASVTVTGLSASTAYDIYAVAEDSAGNLQTAPAKIKVTTSESLTPFVAEATSVEVTGPGNIDIPGTSSVTAAYSAVVKDQNGAVMPDEQVAWSIQGEDEEGNPYDLTGISADAAGVVTVSSEALAPDFFLVASANSGSVYSSFYVVLNDVTRPSVTGLEYVDPTHLRIWFSEPVDDSTAENAAYYKISGDLAGAVSGAVRAGDGLSVLLTVPDMSRMSVGQIITVTVIGVLDDIDSGVGDTSGNPVGETNSAGYTVADPVPPEFIRAKLVTFDDLTYRHLRLEFSEEVSVGQWAYSAFSVSINDLSVSVISVNADEPQVLVIETDTELMRSDNNQVIYNGGTGSVTDLAGNELRAFSFRLDNTPPVLTLLGDNPYTINLGQEYAEPGATANDESDGEIPSAEIIVDLDPSFNNLVPGIYGVTYTVFDFAGNSGTAERQVYVIVPLVTAEGSTGGLGTVTVTGADPGATLYLYNELGNFIFDTDADETGFAEFIEVVPGRYYVTQWVNGYESGASHTVDVT